MAYANDIRAEFVGGVDVDGDGDEGGGCSWVCKWGVMDSGKVHGEDRGGMAEDSEFVCFMRRVPASASAFWLARVTFGATLTLFSCYFALRGTSSIQFASWTLSNSG